MTSASEASMPPMSWEGIEHALNRMHGEHDRLTLLLEDLDDRVCRRLLEGIDLCGATRERWERTSARIHALKDVHDALRRVLDRAAEHLADHGPEAQKRLTLLLTGHHVEVPGAERVTAAEAVALVSAGAGGATGIIDEVERAWRTLNPRLRELDRLWQEIVTFSDMIEDEAEHEELRSELSRTGDTVRRDPLALVRDGRVDTAPLDALRARLEPLRGELLDALHMRDSYRECVEQLSSAIDAVDTALARVRELPENLPDPVPALRAQVARMDGLRARRRWRDLGVLLGETRRTVHAVADAAREAEGLDPDAAAAAYRHALGRIGAAETPAGRTRTDPGASEGESDGGVR
ncbi:hypothetical protein ACOALZ_15700 [Nocardiopsis algeriensis]|uniref:hypothetical protein n=1 Tax=Nocardiopsis algeriensis TaxID=1478215 RepID=UPI003B43AB3C